MASGDFGDRLQGSLYFLIAQLLLNRLQVLRRVEIVQNVRERDECFGPLRKKFERYGFLVDKIGAVWVITAENVITQLSQALNGEFLVDILFG